jgi:DNA-3-methyladenine glycosylase I
MPRIFPQAKGAMMSDRCGWAGPDPIYVTYHDTDWGVPERDSRALWEKLVLDGFQAGLSWITILKKRDNFRAAFGGFDPRVIATWGEDDITRLLADPGIIRHRGKIAATITNARAWCALESGPGFSPWLWAHMDDRPQVNHWTSQAEVPTQTALSRQLSRNLQQAGFRFCGPTITYAFMQAVGMVNDHIVTCPRHAACATLVTPHS